jgi:phosphate transport system substrate-binding protein
MGALFTPPQLEAYRAAAGHDPVSFRVAHASLNETALSGPLAVFVHSANPIASVSLADLARVYSGKATRWGDLGMEGVWAARPIEIAGVAPGTALAYEFAAAVMEGGAFPSRLAGLPQSAQVVEWVAAHPHGVGFAAAMRATPAVRVVPVAARAGEPGIAPTAQSISSGRYPLDRHLFIYARRPLSSFARRFVGIALSPEGQAVVAASPQGYLPLSAREVVAERAKLEAMNEDSGRLQPGFIRMP